MAKTPKTAQKSKAPKTSAKPAQKNDEQLAPNMVAEAEQEQDAIMSEIDSVAAGAGYKPIPGVFKLLWQAMVVIKQNWRVLLGLAFIYSLLNLLLIQALYTTSNLSLAKSSLELFKGGIGGSLENGVSLYTYLIGASGGNIAPTAGAYQFALAVVITLATIWSLRQIYAGRQIRLRDGFYYGMYPLVTYLLVLLMVLAHLAPFILGSVLYGMVAANGIASTPFETLSFLTLFLGLAVVSLYLLCSSLIAIYIVTLPEVAPMTALRSARDLVVYRRWTVMRKIAFLPLALLVLGGVVMIPVLLFATVLAPWIFTMVAAVLLVLAHSYMYALYRSLL